MNEQPATYISPKACSRPIPDKRGWGVFALEPFEKDELITVWGGDILHANQFFQLDPVQQSLSIQVDEDLYMVTRIMGEGDCVNHSCDPNAGMRGQISLVAMRSIAAGEEIVFDYAMTDGSVYDEFECQCGTAYCRHFVTGNDWQRPELIERYAGYFSTYLQRRIDLAKVKVSSNGFKGRTNGR